MMVTNTLITHLSVVPGPENTGDYNIGENFGGIKHSYTKINFCSSYSTTDNEDTHTNICSCKCLVSLVITVVVELC